MLLRDIKLDQAEGNLDYSLKTNTNGYFRLQIVDTYIYIKSKVIVDHDGFYSDYCRNFGYYRFNDIKDHIKAYNALFYDKDDKELSLNEVADKLNIGTAHAQKLLNIAEETTYNIICQRIMDREI